MEGLGGVSAEAGDLLNCIREAGAGRAGRLPAPAWGQSIALGERPAPGRSLLGRLGPEGQLVSSLTSQSHDSPLKPQTGLVRVMEQQEFWARGSIFP